MSFLHVLTPIFLADSSWPDHLQERPGCNSRTVPEACQLQQGCLRGVLQRDYRESLSLQSGILKEEGTKVMPLLN